MKGVIYRCLWLGSDFVTCNEMKWDIAHELSFECLERLESMPKMKTIKGAAKRFKRTASGRIKRNKAFASHLLKCKTTKRKRNYRRATLVTSSDEKRINRMIK